MPPKNDVVIAAIGRRIAKAGPSSDHVAAMLSTPVWGVEIRNADVADLDAPLRCMATAVGNTPQEHSGSGTPISDALTTDFHPG